MSKKHEFDSYPIRVFVGRHAMPDSYLINEVVMPDKEGREALLTFINPAYAKSIRESIQRCRDEIEAIKAEDQQEKTDVKERMPERKRMARYENSFHVEKTGPGAILSRLTARYLLHHGFMEGVKPEEMLFITSTFNRTKQTNEVMFEVLFTDGVMAVGAMAISHDAIMPGSDPKVVQNLIAYGETKARGKNSQIKLVVASIHDSTVGQFATLMTKKRKLVDRTDFLGTPSTSSGFAYGYKGRNVIDMFDAGEEGKIQVVHISPQEILVATLQNLMMIIEKTDPRVEIYGGKDDMLGSLGKAIEIFSTLMDQRILGEMLQNPTTFHGVAMAIKYVEQMGRVVEDSKRTADELDIGKEIYTELGRLNEYGQLDTLQDYLGIRELTPRMIESRVMDFITQERGQSL